MVIAAKLAGVKALPAIINAVLLCTVLSAANSNVYSASRVIIGLANEGMAPSFFKRKNRGDVPYYAVAFTAAFGLLGFLNEASGATTGFNWLVDMSGVAGFIAWACISVSHLAFMKALKARGVSRDSLPFKAILQPWFTYYSLFFLVLIILTQGFTSFIPWDAASFFSDYISLILFVVLYIGHKVWFRTKFVPSAEADLDSGRKEVDEMHFVDPPEPTTIWGKALAWLG